MGTQNRAGLLLLLGLVFEDTLSELGGKRVLPRCFLRKPDLFGDLRPCLPLTP